MLAKENRLKKNKDFEKVFKQGKGLKQGFLYLKILKNKELSSSRFGIVASKNYSQKAVERNRIKRRISEIIRINLSEIKKGIDGVIVVMPGAEDDFKKLEKTIKQLFKKANITVNSKQ